MSLKLFIKKTFKNLSLDDLPPNVNNIGCLRRNTKVLIIDDQEFIYEDGLREADFDITVRKKWNGVQDVVPFAVIVSDNHGVVERADGSDGLTMVNEGRKLFPDKKFGLYSGNLLDIRQRDAEGLVIRTKGDDLNIWINMLDQLITDFYNPIKQWENIRSILKKSYIKEIELRRFQHYYVLSILEKRCKIKERGWNIDTETLHLIIRIVQIAVTGAKIGLSI